MSSWRQTLIALSSGFNVRFEWNYNPQEHFSEVSPEEQQFLNYGPSEDFLSIIISDGHADIGFTTIVMTEDDSFYFKERNKMVVFPKSAPKKLPKIVVITIYVSPDYRGKGIGKLLQHELVNYLNSKFGVGKYTFIQGISTNDGERMIEYRRKLLPANQPYFILDHRKKEKDNGTFQETASP